MKKEYLEPHILRELLQYDPETGVLVWRARNSGSKQDKNFNARFLGKPALTANVGNGYLHGEIVGHRVLAHRVVWAFVHGEWPDGQIDHINGDRADNRIANLRVVTAAGNAQNLALRLSNKSGAHGVTFCKRRSKWRARVNVFGSERHLGEFRNIEDAIRARKLAEQALGYHPNHGGRVVKFSKSNLGI